MSQISQAFAVKAENRYQRAAYTHAISVAATVYVLQRNVETDIPDSPFVVTLASDDPSDDFASKEALLGNDTNASLGTDDYLIQLLEGQRRSSSFFDSVFDVPTVDERVDPASSLTNRVLLGGTVTPAPSIEGLPDSETLEKLAEVHPEIKIAAEKIPDTVGVSELLSALSASLDRFVRAQEALQSVRTDVHEPGTISKSSEPLALQAGDRNEDSLARLIAKLNEVEAPMTERLDQALGFLQETAPLAIDHSAVVIAL